MHPELMGRMARRSTADLTREATTRRRVDRRAWLPEPDRVAIVRRARRQLGAAMLDAGLHLLATT